ncbi:MAG: hypothetical protein Q8936_01275 [Bacillota bacterium]|nr:hypothetical protein [Bacillota bacterium]
MLQKIIRFFINSKKTRQSLYAEDIIYRREVYPFYVSTSNAFRYCMQNRLLKRKDILELKDMLNGCINQKDYRFEKYKNDAHEIYSKLKSTSITKNEMLMLNDYLQQFVVEIPQLKMVGHLWVAK